MEKIRPNIIAQHEHTNRTPYRTFISWYWQERQPGPMPDPDNRQGTVQAFVDHGRWIVRCPRTWDDDGVQRQCGNAVVVTEADPFYICTIDGSPENNGKPYSVVFPANKTAIERILLHRPGDNGAAPSTPWENRHRWWKPGETLADLITENQARGYPTEGPPPERF